MTLVHCIYVLMFQNVLNLKLRDFIAQSYKPYLIFRKNMKFWENLYVLSQFLLIQTKLNF